jgi:hypothetical protein
MISVNKAKENCVTADSKRRKERSMENGIENLTMGAPELAKHSTVSFSLEGWPAAAVLISLPASVVAIYAIKAFAHC